MLVLLIVLFFMTEFLCVVVVVVVFNGEVPPAGKLILCMSDELLGLEADEIGLAEIRSELSDCLVGVLGTVRCEVAADIGGTTIGWNDLWLRCKSDSEREWFSFGGLSGTFSLKTKNIRIKELIHKCKK